VIVAVLAGLAAGGCFALSGVLQQQVASGRPPDESMSLRLILDLVRQRRWLVGLGLAVVSYALQALALAFGPLAVVQPLLVTELLFAIPLSARIRGRRIGLREWGGAGAVAGGLALGIAASDPRGGTPLAPVGEWVLVLVSVTVVAAAAALVGRRVSGPLRAALFAASAAVTLGVEAALLQATTRVFEQGPAHGFSSWEPYAMAVASITGLVLVQSAYQAGPLAVSLPIIDTVEPTVAVIIAVTIFGEQVSVSTGALALTAAGLLALLAGILVLDTSPLVHDLYRAVHGDEDAGGQTGESGSSVRPVGPICVSTSRPGQTPQS
jgi:drug/metabolite transporter (DMT)-like permease